MTDVAIRATFAGPLVSVQDAGRFGRMRFGVPASGPMDRLAHATANSVLGNAPGATAIEVSLGGVTLECLSGGIAVAVAGGGFAVDHDGRQRSAWSAFTVKSGEQVSVSPGKWGSWAYIAFAGVIDAVSWLGSTATHSPSGLGGGMLSVGDELVIKEARISESRNGPIPAPSFAHPIQRVRVVPGPQQHHFGAQAMRSMTGATYTLSGAYDRMGVRLDGERLPLRSALSIPSEPIVQGSIQVAGDGVPTVLLADHQTTGGYPKVATVVSGDLDQFAQLRAGQEFRFEAVTPAEAVSIARKRQESVAEFLAAIAKPGRSFAHRLYGENLIGGVVAAGDADRASD